MDGVVEGAELDKGADKTGKTQEISQLDGKVRLGLSEGNLQQATSESKKLSTTEYDSVVTGKG